MKACIIQPYYSFDHTKIEECFEGMMKIIDRCDDSMDLIVLREIRDTFPNAGIEMYPFEVARMFSINLTPFSEQHFTSQGIEFVQISDPAEALFDFAEKIVQ